MTLAPPSTAVKAATIPVEPEPTTTISVFAVFAALVFIVPPQEIAKRIEHSVTFQNLNIFLWFESVCKEIFVGIPVGFSPRHF
jgi:hypothetical protein